VLIPLRFVINGASGTGIPSSLASTVRKCLFGRFDDAARDRLAQSRGSTARAGEADMCVIVSSPSPNNKISRRGYEVGSIYWLASVSSIPSNRHRSSIVYRPVSSFGFMVEIHDLEGRPIVLKNERLIALDSLNFLALFRVST